MTNWIASNLDLIGMVGYGIFVVFVAVTCLILADRVER